MTRRIHPDELDRIAARGAAAASTVPASVEEVAAALDRILVTGRLARIPRNPRHRDILLAILCRDVRRRHRYTERELNEQLAAGLHALHAGVDHVSCRRYLVDLGFLKRDRAGTRYFLNYPKIEATLTVEALEAATTLVSARIRRVSGNGAA